MSSLNSLIVDSISRELDVCALRHEAYSANIANASVPGYERLEVMTSSPVNVGAMPSAQLLHTHDAVKLDQEMAKLSKNAVRYETLLTAYQQTTSILNLAIKEGKGA